jgi:hypothetical protein
MKRLAFAVCAVALVACAKSDTSADSAGASAAAAAPAPAEPAPLKAADLAGTWSMTGKNTANDSTVITYETAFQSDTAFTITFANGQKVPGKIISVGGDSLVFEAGPYASVLRKGVQVKTNGVFRLQDGKLVGTTTAHYNTKKADSVMTIRTEGTRKP